MIASPNPAAQEPCVPEVVVPEQKPKGTPPVPAPPADPSPTPTQGGAAGGAATPSPASVKEALSLLVLAGMEAGELLAAGLKRFTADVPLEVAAAFIDGTAELLEQLRATNQHLVYGIALCRQAEELDWPACITRDDHGRLVLLHPSNGIRITNVPIPPTGTLVEAAERWHQEREAAAAPPPPPHPLEAVRCWQCERRHPAGADPEKCYNCQAPYPTRGNPLLIRRKAGNQ